MAYVLLFYAAIYPINFQIQTNKIIVYYNVPSVVYKEIFKTTNR